MPERIYVIAYPDTKWDWRSWVIVPTDRAQSPRFHHRIFATGYNEEWPIGRQEAAEILRDARTDTSVKRWRRPGE